MFRPLRILAAFRTGSATTISKWRIVDRQAQAVGVYWQVEQPLLHPLPAHPFACCVSREVTLNGYGQVTFETNRYSVPADKARKHLTLRTYPFIIEVLADNQLIATHPRSYARQQDILDPLHYLALLLERPGAFEHALPLREWRAKWPPAYETLLSILRQSCLAIPPSLTVGAPKERVVSSVPSSLM